ncbi:site-specific integrase [Sediminibacterium soli]|uniref:site-specific integrase n=1 Tax=Sediminibacterium soli TaxID=2698829 RepID=UPI00192A524A|nr:site-specific integrase [Sediminibacterium soli]
MGVKIVLRKRVNGDGTRPLILQVCKDKQTSTIHLGYALHEKYWDAKKQEVRSSYPNSVRMNKLLFKKKMEVLSGALDVESEHGEATSRAIIKKVKPSKGADFMAQAEAYLERLKQAGKYNQYTADKPRVKHFRDFRNNVQTPFSEVTVSLLEDFKVYLGNLERPLSERSIVNHLVVIRSVFGQAIKEGVADRRHYPFGADKIRIKFPEVNKIGLTIEEVQRLQSAIFPVGSFQEHSRNLWLFSFYAAGMRASDVLRLKWNDIKNGRLYYVMGKNNKSGSVMLSEKAQAILDLYRQKPQRLSDFVFPDLKVLDNESDKFIVQRRIAFTVSRIDKFLQAHVAPAAKVEKRLTMHIARRTFGNISGDRIPIQMLQKLYRHSSITTTLGYQSNFISKDTDDALAAVVTF